jgi:hypothetical protein
MPSEPPRQRPNGSHPTPALTPERQALRRRSQIAGGVGLIALTMLLETVMAHQRLPNPASPLVWTLLGSVGAGSWVAAWWWRRRALHGT